MQSPQGGTLVFRYSWFSVLAVFGTRGFPICTSALDMRSDILACGNIDDVFSPNFGSEEDVSIAFRRICLDARERKVGPVWVANSNMFAAEISCSFLIFYNEKTVLDVEVIEDTC